MMLYGRARYSDLVNAEILIDDRDDKGETIFVEARTRKFKVANMVAMEGDFMNILLPAIGVHGRNWGAQWCAALRSSSCGWPVEAPLVRAHSGLAWLKRPPSHGEVGGLLRRTLARA
eukprot:3344502-Amphidinium_carterae.1